MMIEGSGSGSIGTSEQWIRIREAQKHVDPVDPDSDPQDCLVGNQPVGGEHRRPAVQGQHSHHQVHHQRHNA